MKNIICKLLAAIAFAGIVASCTSSTDKSKNTNNTQKTLKIAYLPITHTLPLFVANELPDSLKQFKNLELVKFGSWPELVEALNTGKIDGASMLVQLALKSKEAGFPLKAVALGHRDGNVVVASPDINKPEDLIGKTIAIPHRLSSHNILLRILLKKAGIDIAKVNILELPPPEMPAALAEKRISAYVVAEPFGAKGVVAGSGKVLAFSNELWENSICCAIVLRDSVIKNNHAEVEAFMNDYLKAGDLLASNFDPNNTVAKKYLKVDEAVLKQSLQWISFNNLAINKNDYSVLTQWLEELKLGQIPAPAYTDFVDDSFTTNYYTKK